MSGWSTMFGWVFKIQGRRLGRWNGPKQAKTEIAIKKIPPGFTSENFHSVLTTPIQNKYKKNQLYYIFFRTAYIIFVQQPDYLTNGAYTLKVDVCMLFNL